MPNASIVATRVTWQEARRHFAAGGRVLVSEYGHRSSLIVGPSTTTHSRETTTWDELGELVRMWRGRYPNQRFYVIPSEVADSSADASRAAQQTDYADAIRPLLAPGGTK